MKFSDVNPLLNSAISLVNHLNEKKVKNSILLMGLLDNIDTLEAESKRLDKIVDPELKDLETKAIELQKKAFEKMPDDEKAVYPNDFKSALTLLSKTEKKRHEELFEAYKKEMDKESKVVISFIDRADIKEVQLDLEWSIILKQFSKSYNK